MKKETIVIEYPSRGETYYHKEYGVYSYGVYPKYSVLAGQTKRCFLASFATLEEAKKNFPGAGVACGSLYEPVNLNYLPEEEL